MGNQPSKQNAIGNDPSRDRVPTSDQVSPTPNNERPAPQSEESMADPDRVTFTTGKDMLSEADRDIIRERNAQKKKKNKSNIQEGQDDPGRRQRTPHPRTSRIQNGESSRVHNERRANQSQQSLSFYELRDELRDFYESSMGSQNNTNGNSDEAGSRDNHTDISDEAEPKSHQELSHQELRDFYESSMGSQDNPMDLSDEAETSISGHLPNNVGLQRERSPDFAELEQNRSPSRTLSPSSSNYKDSTRSPITTGVVAPPPSDYWSASASRSQSESWTPDYPGYGWNEMHLQAPAAPSPRFSRVHEALLMDSQQRQLSSPISTFPPVSPSDSHRELVSPTPLPPPTPQPRFSRVLVDGERDLLPPTTSPRYGRDDGAPPFLPPLLPMNNRRRFLSPSPISPLPPPNPYYGMHSRHPSMLVPLSPNTHYGMHLQPSSLLRPLPPRNAHNGMHLPFLAPLPPYSTLARDFQHSSQNPQATPDFKDSFEGLHGTDMLDEQSTTPPPEFDALSWGETPSPARSDPTTTWGEPPSPSLFEARQLPPEEIDENESMPSLETVSDTDSEMVYQQSRTPSPNPHATPYDEFGEFDAMTWMETLAPSQAPYDDFYENEYAPSPEPGTPSDSNGERSEDSICIYCDGDAHRGPRTSPSYEPEGEEEKEEGSPSRLTSPRWDPPRYRY